MTQQLMLYIALVVTALPHTLTDRAVARAALKLLDTAGATEQFEHAAFIIRTPAGNFDLLRWTQTGFHAASWAGPIPAGVVAVIHTHPRSRPMPSMQDRAEAVRLAMPFYIVSRGALCLADVTGGVYCAERIPWVHRGNDVALNWLRRATGTS